MADTTTRHMRHYYTLLAEAPGAALAPVQKSRSGLLRWLEQIQDKLLHDISPGLRRAPHVRGAKVAIDYLLDAIIREGTLGSLTMVVPQSKLAGFREWLDKRSEGHEAPQLQVLSTSSLTEKGSEMLRPDVWINLDGDGILTNRIRYHLSETVFPTITVQHGLSAHNLLYDRYTRILMSPHYATDSFVCTSEACKNALQNIFSQISERLASSLNVRLTFKGRLDVIPLCVDTETFKPRDKAKLRAGLRIPPNSCVLLYVGYLSQVKADLLPLLSVLKRLIANNPTIPILLVIVGTGLQSYRVTLEKALGRLHLSKYVHLIYDAPDAIKCDLYGAADIFVAPCDSLQESFGLTPVEAMASGLPQVVADWSGYRETVSDGITGFLIPTWWGKADTDMHITGDIYGWPYDHIVQGQAVVLDLDQLFERLQLLIRQPELRRQMSEASRARALERFSYRVVANHYDCLIDDLTAHVDPRSGDRTPQFDDPAYFENFRHYATRCLDEQTIIRRARQTEFSLAELIQGASVDISEAPVLREKILTEILNTVSAKGEGTRVYSVLERLAPFANNGAHSRTTTMRHILFLIKHGVLSVQDE